jgi:hypothetical protein
MDKKGVIAGLIFVTVLIVGLAAYFWITNAHQQYYLSHGPKHGTSMVSLQHGDVLLEHLARYNYYSKPNFLFNICICICSFKQSNLSFLFSLFS